MRQWVATPFLLLFLAFGNFASAQLSDSDFVTLLGEQPNYPENPALEPLASQAECRDKCRSTAKCTFAAYNEQNHDCFISDSTSVLDHGLYANRNVTSFFRVSPAAGGTEKLISSFAHVDVAFPWNAADSWFLSPSTSFAQCLRLCSANPKCASFSFWPVGGACNGSVKSLLRAVKVTPKQLARKQPADNSIYFEKLEKSELMFNVYTQFELQSPDSLVGTAQKISVPEAAALCLAGETCMAFNYDLGKGEAQLLSTMLNENPKKNSTLLAKEGVAYVEMKVIKSSNKQLFDRTMHVGQVVLPFFPLRRQFKSLEDSSVSVPIPKGMAMLVSVTRFPPKEGGTCGLELRIKYFSEDGTRITKEPHCDVSNQSYAIEASEVSFDFDTVKIYNFTSRSAYRKHYNCSKEIVLQEDVGSIDFKDFFTSPERTCRWKIVSATKKIFLFFFRLPKLASQLNIENGSQEIESKSAMLLGSPAKISYTADSDSAVSDFVIFYRQTDTDIKVFQKNDEALCLEETCVLEVTTQELEHLYIDFTQRFGINDTSSDDVIKTFQMDIKVFGFGHRDPEGKCHYGEVLVFEGADNKTSAEPFLTMCGVWSPQKIHLPFSSATVKFRYAKPKDDTFLSSEETKGVKVIFETVQVKKPAPEEPSITNGTADVSVPVDAHGLYSNNLNLRWYLKGDPQDEDSDRWLLFSLQMVELATIPGLGTCDNDRLVISSGNKFRYSLCGRDPLRQTPRIFFSSATDPLEVTFQSDDRHQGRGMDASISVEAAFVGSPKKSTPVTSSGFLISPAFPALMPGAAFKGSALAWELSASNCSSVRLLVKTAQDGEPCKALKFSKGPIKSKWLCGNESSELQLPCGVTVSWENPDGNRLAALVTIIPIYPRDETTSTEATTTTSITPEVTSSTTIPKVTVTPTPGEKTTTGRMTTTAGGLDGDDKGGRGGLSGGAKAAISVSLILVLMIVAYFCYHYWRGTLRESCVVRCFTESGSRKTPNVRYEVAGGGTGADGEVNVAFHNE